MYVFLVCETPRLAGTKNCIVTNTFPKNSIREHLGPLELRERVPGLLNARVRHRNALEWAAVHLNSGALAYTQNSGKNALLTLRILSSQQNALSQVQCWA